MSTNRMKQIRLTVLGVMVLVASLVFVACGGGGIDEGTGNEEIPTAPGGEASGSLKISNWTYYIDPKTIDDFQKETGIQTTYDEDVNDNDEFFGKVQQQLSQGDSGGRDMIVVTDWMAKKMYDLGFIQNLNPDDLTTAFDNMLPSLRSPSFDPDRSFSIPWQSGMTGLVVRTDLAPDIKSINDLFDPQYEGKVTFLKEMRDTVPLVMAADGVDPADATTEDWMNAIDKIGEAASSGQIRKFTGNNYLQDLAKGDVVAAIGWSGDAVQAQADNENIAYVQPTEGCSLWSDNMLIPVGAPNSPAAYAFMNYVYEPENQAQIAEYVNYVSPVNGVKEVLVQKDPDLANNDLIFPPDEFIADCFTQDSPPAEDEQEITQAFQDVINR